MPDALSICGPTTRNSTLPLKDLSSPATPAAEAPCRDASSINRASAAADPMRTELEDIADPSDCDFGIGLERSLLQSVCVAAEHDLINLARRDPSDLNRRVEQDQFFKLNLQGVVVDCSGRLSCEPITEFASRKLRWRKSSGPDSRAQQTELSGCRVSRRFLATRLRAHKPSAIVGS